MWTVEVRNIKIPVLQFISSTTTVYCCIECLLNGNQKLYHMYKFLILILLEGAVCCGVLFASFDVEVLCNNYWHKYNEPPHRQTPRPHVVAYAGEWQGSPPMESLKGWLLESAEKNLNLLWNNCNDGQYLSEMLEHTGL